MLSIVLCLASCIDDRQTFVSGTLYTDSTLTTPIAHDTLLFYWMHNSKYIGQSITDDLGDFAISFWENGADTWDDTYLSKFQMDYPMFLIKYKGDTLETMMSHGKITWLELYPGMPYYYY